VVLEHAYQRVLYRVHVDFGQTALAVERRKPGCGEQRVAFAQRDLERFGELHHHLLAGARPARFEKAQMSL